MPLCSVIVPVYNTEQFLPACIESVLAQTQPNWELLLVDDGSPDSSGAVCDRYALQDGRIRVFHQPNQGVSAARNKGLSEARGQWLFFLDSDDKLSPVALETALAAQALYPHDLLYWDFCGLDGTLQASFSTSHLPVESMSFDRLGTLWCVEYSIGIVWNKLFSTALVKKAGLLFPKSLEYMEDNVFVLDYCRALREHVPGCCLRHLQLPLYFYDKRVNSSSITNTHGLSYARRQYSGVPALVQAGREFGCSAHEMDLIHNHYLSCVIYGLTIVATTHELTHGEKRRLLRELFRCPEARALASYFSAEHFYTPLYIPFLLHSAALTRFWFWAREKHPVLYGKLDWGFYKLFFRNWRRL